MHSVHSWWSALPDVDKDIVAPAALAILGWLGWLVSKVPTTLRWWRLRKLRKLAQFIRDYSDFVRSFTPGQVFFQKAMFTRQLKGKLPFYLTEGDVIDFMEEKGWAEKIRHGDWQIN
jgi:hypothetical protein